MKKDFECSGQTFDVATDKDRTTIIFGKTSDDLLQQTIELVGKDSGHRIIIVPDRMTVVCEKKIFEQLGICSTCDIEVVTISRLCSRILPDTAVITKNTSVMLVQKILIENRDKLKYFGKGLSADLAETIFGTIAQFKSCKVSPEEVCKAKCDDLLSNKLADISLIYDEYQKNLAKRGLCDSLDRLNILENVVKDSELIKSSSIYITNFDGWTYQGFAILSQCAKVCKKFCVALTYPDNPSNEHIYIKSFAENVLKMLPNAKTIFAPSVRNKEFEFLSNNLFSFAPNSIKVENSPVVLFQGKNFLEELQFCIGEIRSLIKNGVGFEQIFVAIPNLLSKREIVERELAKNDINFFVDLPQDFSQTILPQFVDSIFDVVQENFSQKSMLRLLKNPLFGANFDDVEDFEDYILCYSADDFASLQRNYETSEYFEGFKRTRELLFDVMNQFVKDITHAGTFADFVASYTSLLERLNLQEKIDNMAHDFFEKGNLKQAKLFEQYYSAFYDIMEQIKNLLGEEECDHKMFYSTLKVGLGSVKISTTPLSCDAVFVGDCSSSFFEGRDFGFILSASEGSFPKNITDCGLVSDQEIGKLESSYKLEPTIFELNQKERFKAFELLCRPKERLFLSSNVGSPSSSIIGEIKKMFVVEKDGKFLPIEQYEFNTLPQSVALNSKPLCKQILTQSLRTYADGSCDLNVLDSSLFEALNNNLAEGYLERFNFQNHPKIEQSPFFLQDKTSISEIECFMLCPYLHFVRYGLRLAPKEEGVFDALNVGNILHEVACNLLRGNKLPLDNAVVLSKVDDIFDNIISKDKYLSLQANGKNKVLLKNLCAESKRFALALNEQAKVSKFKPKYFEMRFDDKSRIKSLKIKAGEKIISLVGQVDRIDIFDQFFRVIDYKTGVCDTSLKELFFGKKVQLEAYIKTVQSSLHLKPAGAYYLPIKAGFADEKTSLQAKYSLKGRTLDDVDVILASDKRFAEGEKNSDVVEVKFAQNDGEMIHSRYSKVVGQSQLDNLANYAFELIKKACEDISNCNIEPCPLVLPDDPCARCEYSALCRFDKFFANEKRTPSVNIDIENFGGGER
ncbi:MAG: PD-(D/E)XK nuclease family protein [Christensenellales bacterium]